MNPFILFVLAIFSPLLLAATLLVPPYAGIVAACYIIYDKGAKIHPLDGKLDQVFYMMDVYVQLFTRWMNHMTEASFFTYTAPLLLLPLLSTILSIWLTGKLSTKLMDIFQLGVRN
jgi:hypothetical protein